MDAPQNCAGTLPELDIVVCGAGPAGLTAARLLHQRGIRARVLERDGDRSARTQGGSLDLGEDDGLRVLDAAGLRDGVDRLARPQGQRSNFFDTDGVLLLTTDESDEKEARPEIDRLQLRSLLLDSLPADAVEWGQMIRAVEADGSRWRITTTEGAVIGADLVIGADGIGSRVRPVRTDQAPTYSGVTFIASEITRPGPDSCAAELTGEGTGLVVGADRAFLLQRNGDGSIRVYFAQRRTEDPNCSHGTTLHDPDDIRAHVAAELNEWSPRVRSILDEVDSPFVWWPLYTVPVEQHWNERRGLTLVGDAAHVMPPFTGQGVNMALVDALELVTALTGGEHPGVDDAIAAYEKTMLARMSEAIAATHVAQDTLLSPEGPAAVIAMAGGAA